LGLCHLEVPNDAPGTNLMILKDGKPSEFYQSYVKDTPPKTLLENAANWKEYTRETTTLNET